jgi:hypothetical protein
VIADSIQPVSQSCEKQLQGFALRSGSGVQLAVLRNFSGQGSCIIADIKIGEFFVVTLPNVGTFGA